MLMATQTGASSSQSAIPTTASKQTLLAKSLHARSTTTGSMGQCNSQTQALNAVAGLSQQQVIILYFHKRSSLNYKEVQW
jgi:hypothetical protein